MTRAAAPIGLISNPGSGHNRNQFTRIAERIDRCDYIQHRITRSTDDILPVLRDFADAGIDTLAINGGDGTASAVLGQLLESGLFPTLPHIALLPGGTANMNAGDIGVKGKLAAAVNRFCLWCETPERTTPPIAERALLRVASAAGPVRHGMFLGGGAIIHGTEYAHENIHSRGLRDDFSLALGTLRTVWGLSRSDPAFNRHVPLGISIDGAAPHTLDTVILVISTLQRLAFGMRPFWSNEPGDVRITVFEKGCSRFVRTFVSIIRGKPSKNAVPAQGYRSHNANRLDLALQGDLNLDGEIFSADGEVTITATPKLAFLQL